MEAQICQHNLYAWIKQQWQSEGILAIFDIYDESYQIDGQERRVQDKIRRYRSHTDDILGRVSGAGGARLSCLSTPAVHPVFHWGF